MGMATTALGWHLHEDKRRARTLATLAASPFDRVRMAAFPAVSLEERVAELAAIEVTAELVLAPPATEEHVRDVVGRLSGHENVWWSLAADAALFPEVGEHEWVRLAELVAEEDHGHHPLSISAAQDSPLLWRRIFTHGSVVGASPRQAWVATRDHWKPVHIDQSGYEGDGDEPWQSLTAEEVVDQAWDGALRRRPVTHGEWYADDDGLTWSADGGTLRGAAVERLRLLDGIVGQTPREAVYRDRDAPMLALDGEYYLEFCGEHRFPQREHELPEGRYAVEVIDAWEMTVRSLGVHDGGGTVTVPLPAAEHQAIRVRRVP